MDWTKLHEQEIAARKAKRAAKQIKIAIPKQDFVAALNPAIRAGAFRHFCNLLAEFRQIPQEHWLKKSVCLKRREIRDMSERWKFTLPEWF